MVQIGPVCHIPPENDPNQPNPVHLPNIPPAQPNLQSLTATVNAMRQVIMLLAGQNGINGRPGAAGAGAKLKPPQWKEKSRVTEEVTIYNPDDPSQFIKVDRINKLVMEDKKNDQTWEWSR